MLSAELKAFYMVARLGSITLAAKKLGLSQPTVTTQIRNRRASTQLSCSTGVGGAWC